MASKSVELSIELEKISKQLWEERFASQKQKDFALTDSNLVEFVDVIAAKKEGKICDL